MPATIVAKRATCHTTIWMSNETFRPTRTPTKVGGHQLQMALVQSNAIVCHRFSIFVRNLSKFGLQNFAAASHSHSLMSVLSMLYQGFLEFSIGLSVSGVSVCVCVNKRNKMLTLVARTQRCACTK